MGTKFKNMIPWSVIYSYPLRSAARLRECRILNHLTVLKRRGPGPTLVQNKTSWHIKALSKSKMLSRSFHFVIIKILFNMFLMLLASNQTVFHLAASGYRHITKELYRGLPEDAAGSWPQRAASGPRHIQLGGAQQTDADPRPTGESSPTSV